MNTVEIAKAMRVSSVLFLDRSLRFQEKAAKRKLTSRFRCPKSGKLNKTRTRIFQCLGKITGSDG